MTLGNEATDSTGSIEEKDDGEGEGEKHEKGACGALAGQSVATRSRCRKKARLADGAPLAAPNRAEPFGLSWIETSASGAFSFLHCKASVHQAGLKQVRMCFTCQGGFNILARLV